MGDFGRITDEEHAGQLGALLRAAQSDVLTDEQVARIRRGLATTALVISPGAAIAKKAALTPFKLSVVLVAGGIVGMVAFSLMSPEPSAPALAAPTRATPRVTSAVIETPASSPVAATSSTPLRPKSSSAAPVGATSVGRPSLAAAAPSTPSNEGVLLLRARAALEQDPARALALVRAHEQQFPNSQLAPERARIAAEARRRIQR
jgi:hypothetical protein